MTLDHLKNTWTRLNSMLQYIHKYLLTSVVDCAFGLVWVLSACWTKHPNRIVGFYVLYFRFPSCILFQLCFICAVALYIYIYIYTYIYIYIHKNIYKICMYIYIHIIPQTRVALVGLVVLLED